MMTFQCFTLGIAALLIAPSAPCAAQLPHASVLFGAVASPASDPFDTSSAPRPSLNLRASPAPDYRWEGAIIGAVVTGGAMTLYFLRVCEVDCTKSSVKIFIGTGILGAITGALIGGAIPKSP